MTNFILAITDRPAREDEAAIAKGLDDYDAEVGLGREPLLILAHDADGGLAGGLNAAVIAGHFYIRHLWVSRQNRGTGLGRTLIARAEDEAIRRGCRRIHVDSWQAPGFYARLGYRSVATVPGFIDARDRVFFEKDIEQE